MQWRSLLLCLAILVVMADAHGLAGDWNGHRYTYEGDGQISLTGLKNGHTFTGTYRLPSGFYDETAYQAICQVFDAPYTPHKTGLSLRLIAFLDYLEDHLSPGSKITITSGYRHPQYNAKLRQSGRLAAKASLHQYGMAADLKINGVKAVRIWEFVKKLGFGGTGYYQGETVHLDVGPARFWDEKTSGVGTGISDDNKLIGLVSDFDRYHPNEMITLRFIRMTAFPIGVVPEFVLEREDGLAAETEVMRFTPRWASSGEVSCRQARSIGQMASIQWRLPADLPAGRYAISARFCDPSWERMPAQVVTPAFSVRTP